MGGRKYSTVTYKKYYPQNFFLQGSFKLCYVFFMAYKTPAWTRKAGKNPKGGLNAKGRASYKGGTLKAPVKSGDHPRRASFLARMGNMRGPEYKDGKPTRLLLSLRAWGASSKADARKKAKAMSIRLKNKKKKGKK